MAEKIEITDGLKIVATHFQDIKIPYYSIIPLHYYRPLNFEKWK